MDSDAPMRRSLADDARSVAWWLLVGAGAGAMAGFVVGGIGGRLAMLLLRLTSPEIVIGLTSDDGFVIGEVTVRTLQLALGMTMLGAIYGVAYALLRPGIPAALRLPLWAGFAALAGGATFVHEDGIDFRLLEPAALSIAIFVALPGVAAALVVLLVERWSVAAPWADRRLTTLLVVATLGSTFALVPVALAFALALAVRRSDRTAEALRHAGRVAVPTGIVALAALAGLNLVRESIRILD